MERSQNEFQDHALKITDKMGIPWWSSQDSMLSLPWAWAHSLVGELRSRKLLVKVGWGAVGRITDKKP